jgi:nitrogen fixation-related uncharacterized protein
VRSLVVVAVVLAVVALGVFIIPAAIGSGRHDHDKRKGRS